jgi:hypothetical protein
MSTATESGTRKRTTEEWVEAFAEGCRQVEMRTIDKVAIRDGLAIERVAGLDPSPLLAAVALAPRAWPAFTRAQLERLRGAAAVRGAGR